MAARVLRPGALLRASHPEPAAAVTAVSAAFCLAGGAGAAAGGVAVAVGAGQLSVGWGNDWLDAGRDRGAGRHDKPVAAGTLAPVVVLRAALASLAVCVVTSLAVDVRGGLLHLAAVGSAWGYDLGWKATRVSVVPYLVSFGLLPAFLTSALPGSPWPPGWLVAGTALLGGGAHFANALPDLTDDVAAGVRGLPHRLGAGPSRLVAAGAVGVAAVVLVLGPPGPAGWPSLALLGAALAAGVAGLLHGAVHEGSRAPFLGVLVVTVLAVGALLAAGGASGSPAA